MKTLVFLFSVLAVTSAQWAQAHHGYHIPVIGPGGVPVETPEVQHARAAHLAALNQASAGASHYNGQSDGYNNDDDRRYHGPHAYQTTHGIAKVTHDGVPLDTPEVAAAKANHFGLFSEALGRVAHSYQGGHHYRKRRSIYAGAWNHGAIHIPVIGPHGVPVDTPEVQHARAAHLAAHASAGGHIGYHAYAPVHSYGFQGISHDGRPLDSPEVAHARAAHFAAYNAAAALNGVGHYGHGGYASPWALGAHGVPADTPEVAHAKAAHFAAHAAARGHHY